MIARNACMDLSARRPDPMPVIPMEAELAQLEVQGLRRNRRVVESSANARFTIGARDYLAFSSNDYLGLAGSGALVAAAQEGAAIHGVGAGASHLLLGHRGVHHALEEALARFVGLPGALLFSTGYMANIGIVTALAGREDAVFGDRLNHASLNDAALLSRARFQRYPHLDVDALDARLAASRAKRKIILSDTVFSMDGDIAPVTELLRLAEKHDAWLVLDDAHGFGVLGTGGRGALAHFNVASPRIVYMATLGKAAGVSGAFVAGAASLVEYLIQRARTYIYTTASPPLLAHALLTSLKLITDGQSRRNRLAALIVALKAGLSGGHWQLLPSDTPIQPLLIGKTAEATRVSALLADDGLMVPAIRPPTVPQGTARLRISLSAAHTEDDIARLVATLRRITPQR
jgi:8-amino-7-oxononanoate synthase